MRSVRTLIAAAVFVAIVTFIVAAAAYAMSSQQAKQYSATAKLLFSPTPRIDLQVLGVNPGSPPDATTQTATDQGLVASGDVADATASQLPGYSSGEVSSHVAVVNERGTFIIDVTATAANAVQASTLANAYANAYLKVTQGQDAARASQARAALAGEYAHLSRADKAGQQGGALMAQMGQLGVIQRIGTGSPQLFQSAAPAGAPSAPQTTRNVLFGALFGLVLGIALVSLRLRLSAGPPDDGAVTVRRQQTREGLPYP